LFKKATGLSPSRYFIGQRVARAQLLLQETDASIIEIGMSVGYSSPSHFAQVFRRETGLPPSHYRRG
jgi:AraC family transcriptional regulator